MFDGSIALEAPGICIAGIGTRGAKCSQLYGERNECSAITKTGLSDYMCETMIAIRSVFWKTENWNFGVELLSRILYAP